MYILSATKDTGEKIDYSEMTQEEILGFIANTLHYNKGWTLHIKYKFPWEFTQAKE